MDMSKQKERHGGRLFCRCEKYKKGVQTSRRLWRLQKVVSRRVCLCVFQRGSLTLETSLVLPCFCDDRISGREIPDIDTAGTDTGGDCGTGSG